LKKTAFLFPGQGSQAVGMCLDFYQEYDIVRELFDMVDEITRINISQLCLKGPFDDLTETSGKSCLPRCNRKREY